MGQTCLYRLGSPHGYHDVVVNISEQASVVKKLLAHATGLELALYIRSRSVLQLYT